jgi:hypothetical protein
MNKEDYDVPKLGRRDEIAVMSVRDKKRDYSLARNHALYLICVLVPNQKLVDLLMANLECMRGNACHLASTRGG